MRGIDARLEQEARALYGLLLKREPDSGLIGRYIKANQVLFVPEAMPDFSELVKCGVDLEALEFAWRLKNNKNPLTSKLHIMIYLAEARPENFNVFFNSRDRRLKALLILGWHFARSLYKGLKGMVLLRRWIRA